jgi:hypothetical protein
MEAATWWILEKKFDHFEKALKIKQIVVAEPETKSATYDEPMARLKKEMKVLEQMIQQTEK